jgi:nucleolar pre-ribosomal-associated protein 1
VLEHQSDGMCVRQRRKAPSPDLSEQEFKAVQYIRVILGHQKFKTAAAYSSRSRLPLVLLIKTLVDVSPGAIRQSAALQDLVAVYHATTSESDTTLLAIFRSSELAGDSFRDLSSRWSPVPGSTLRSGTQMLTLLDPTAMHRACVRALQDPSEAKNTSESDDTEIYDPLFILSCLARILDADTITAHEWVDLVRSRTLSLAVCSLSSQDRRLRSAADRLLAKVRNRLQVSLNLCKQTGEQPHSHRHTQESEFRERDEINLVLHHAQNTVTDDDAPVPALVALFLAHCLRSVASPEHFLYPVFARFLLQRPLIDTRDVPLFYALLYSNGDNSRKDLHWLIRFLTDGLQSSEVGRVLAL